MDSVGATRVSHQSDALWGDDFKVHIHTGTSYHLEGKAYTVHNVQLDFKCQTILYFLQRSMKHIVEQSSDYL